VANNPLILTDPSGLVFYCILTRGENNQSIIQCSDSTDGTTSTYHVNENACRNGRSRNPCSSNGSDRYSEDHLAPPGLYALLPRVTDGNRIRRGDPVLTSPGLPTGSIRGHNGGPNRGGMEYPIGPHIGEWSDGCPLFPPTDAGRKEIEDFKRRFNSNLLSGGSWISILE